MRCVMVEFEAWAINCGDGFVKITVRFFECMRKTSKGGLISAGAAAFHGAPA